MRAKQNVTVHRIYVFILTYVSRNRSYFANVPCNRFIRHDCTRWINISFFRTRSPTVSAVRIIVPTRSILPARAVRSVLLPFLCKEKWRNLEPLWVEEILYWMWICMTEWRIAIIEIWKNGYWMRVYNVVVSAYGRFNPRIIFVYCVWYTKLLKGYSRIDSYFIAYVW